MMKIFGGKDLWGRGRCESQIIFLWSCGRCVHFFFLICQNAHPSQLFFKIPESNICTYILFVCKDSMKICWHERYRHQAWSHFHSFFSCLSFLTILNLCFFEKNMDVDHVRTLVEYFYRKNFSFPAYSERELKLKIIL